MTALLVEVTRGTAVECWHTGGIVVADAAGRVVASVGDPGLGTFLRSAAKPFQALPVVLSGAADRFGLTVEELAICTGSHNGEPAHRAVVSSILAKIGVSASALSCGFAPPADRVEAAQLVLGQLAPSPLFHGCSGKHAGMLTTCRQRGYPLEGYADPGHPLQGEIVGLLCDLFGLAPDALATGVDGCGVPTFAAPLATIAQGCARLAQPAAGAYHDAATRVVAAMAAYPAMVAGRGRFETDLMRLAAGRVVAKTGAEGALCLMLPERGWGVAIKVEDGNARGLPAIAAALLAQLDVLDEATLAAFTALYPPVVTNGAGAVVGAVRPVFALH